MESELKERSEAPVQSGWDLTSVYKSDRKWRKEFNKWKKSVERLADYGDKFINVDAIIKFLKHEDELEREFDKLGTYALLNSYLDLSNPTYVQMHNEFRWAEVRFREILRFIRAQLLVNVDVWQCELNGRLQPWRMKFERILRSKPHIISEEEERLIQDAFDASCAPRRVFQMLSYETRVNFSIAKDGASQSSADETQPKDVYHVYRTRIKEALNKKTRQYKLCQNTFAALLEASIRQDVFCARKHGFETALQNAMFQEGLTEQVYFNLTEAIQKSLPCYHRYFDLRRKLMKLDQLHVYDLIVPFFPGVRVKYQWEEAVELLRAALQPLGAEYVETMTKGLTTERWVAFGVGEKNKINNPGCWRGYGYSPYIIASRESDFESFFQFAHECGHAMHVWYTACNQPYYYQRVGNYWGEVASSFHEVLLLRYLSANQVDPKMRAWFIEYELKHLATAVFSNTANTLFEFRAHKAAEENQPLSASKFYEINRNILIEFFGPNFVIDEGMELNCLHSDFYYQCFSLYKYTFGIIAGVALADRVLGGGEREREDYLDFLKSGSSAWPLDLLRAAGVDMEKPESIKAAIARIELLVNELESLLS